MKKIIYWGVFLLLYFSPSFYAQNSARANFGNYPADFGIAYFNMLGYSKAPTVKDLFGPNAPFATTFQGVPSVVILESSSSTGTEFTAILSLTIKNPNTGEEVKFMRLQVKLQSDNLTEKSYIRYVRLANLISGQSSEQQSHGSEATDSRVFGFFGGVMEYFWDVSKLKK